MEPYIPDRLPLESLEWEGLFGQVVDANRELARYDGILRGIINPAVLLSPLTTQEAVLSSKIEGTQATLAEVLEYEASPKKKSPKQEDIQEIINYRQAMWQAVESLKERPINLNLIKETHSILLDSVRGRNKARGELRKFQVWIGKPGASIEEATFIPPDPIYLMEHLTNLENYIHYEEKDRLVQLAIIHGQFEIIHPFLDGNGRVGRILIPLFLYEKGLLNKPMFYISGYLEANKEIYYARLKAITEEKDWTGWIEFFLNAILQQAKNNSNRAMAILRLYEEMKGKVTSITRSHFSIDAIDTIFKAPIFNTNDFVEHSKIPKPSAFRILNSLRENGIISALQEARGRTSAVLEFPALLSIVEKQY